MSSSSLYSIIAPIATKFGVPDRLWMTIASVESSFNPGAIGDNGTSFGLFQLHIGGQAPSGVPTSQLLDPATNATYALPDIAAAWKALGSTFDDSITWWTQYAILSGHPGGNVNNSATIEEARSLKLTYDTASFGNVASSGNISTTTLSSLSPSNNSNNNALSGLPAFMDNIGLDLILFVAMLTFAIVGVHFLK